MKFKYQQNNGNIVDRLALAIANRIIRQQLRLSGALNNWFSKLTPVKKKRVYYLFFAVACLILTGSVPGSWNRFGSGMPTRPYIPAHIGLPSGVKNVSRAAPLQDSLTIKY